MCGLTKEDDEEDKVWIECTKCLKWVHKSCLLPHHPHDADDDNFLCPDYTTKKPKQMSTLSFKMMCELRLLSFSVMLRGGGQKLISR